MKTKELLKQSIENTSKHSCSSQHSKCKNKFSFVAWCTEIWRFLFAKQLMLLFQVFAGNTDRNTVITHTLKPHIDARFIRFHPKTHNHNIPCLRVELYGCRKGKSRKNCFCFSVRVSKTLNRYQKVVPFLLFCRKCLVSVENFTGLIFF